jgi:hypothetical protein
MRAPAPARLLLLAQVRLAASLPTVVKDLERVDSAWTALDQQITTTCG